VTKVRRGGFIFIQMESGEPRADGGPCHRKAAGSDSPARGWGCVV